MSKIPTPADQAKELVEYFIQDTGHEKHVAIASIHDYHPLVHVLLYSKDPKKQALGRKFLAEGAAMCDSTQLAQRMIVRGASAAMNESINISAAPGSTFVTSAGDNRSEIKPPEKPRDGPISPVLSAKFVPDSPKEGAKE